jgi:hypothetical protein
MTPARTRDGGCPLLTDDLTNDLNLTANDARWRATNDERLSNRNRRIFVTGCNL